MTKLPTGPELVTLALYYLGGGGTAVDTEEVAMQVHQMAPGRFSWRKYPKQINLELVRVALSDAHKSENGALVNGTGRQGWSLTVAGQRWAKQNAQRLIGKDLKRVRVERTAGSVDVQRRERERVRILTTDAWRQWGVGHRRSDISWGAARDLFRIDRYVTGRTQEMKINRVREMFADDQELDGFLEAAASVTLKEGDNDA